MNTKKIFRTFTALMFVVCTIFALSSCEALNGILGKLPQNNPAGCTHTMEETAEKAATCDQAGNIKYFTCTTCEKVYLDEAGTTETTLEETVVLAKGHKETTLAAVAPTCTETGLTSGKKCSVCNKLLVAQQVVETLDHDLEDVAGLPATCTEAGYTEYKACADCDYIEGKDAIDALGHTEEDVAAVAPTCTETGLTAGKKCSVCGAVIEAQQTVDALGHTEEDLAAVAPTCTATGLTAGKKCSVCQTVTVEQETVDALGHTEEDLAAVAPTCTETGLTTGKKCSVCQTVTVAQETVDALGHTEETLAAVAATCTEAGLTAGVKCSVCQTVITAQQTVDALGHDMDDGVITTPATCTEAGVKTFTCERNCGHTTTEIIDALGHDMDDGEYIVVPNCTEGGTIKYTCKNNCGHTETEEVGPTHNLVDDEEGGKAATCYVDGYSAGKKCTECDYTEGRKVIPAGHSLVDVDAKAATCYADGYNAHKACSACPYTEGKVVAPAGHTGTWVDDGNYEYIVCTTCGRKQTREKNLVIGDVAFPGEEANTRIDFTDTINSVAAGGKYLVFEFDVLFDKNTQASTTEYIFDLKILDGAASAGFSGNLCAQFQFVEKNNVVSVINGTAVNAMPYDTPMGETYLTFRLVGVLDDTQNDAGNYESYYYLYAKVTGSDGPMTLVSQIIKTSTYAGAVSRYDNYKVVLTKTYYPQLVLDFKNASFIRTDDANYLYSACDHVINETVTPATCTAEGSVVRECANCDYSVTEILPAAHIPGAAATCFTEQICTACQAVITPALGHDFAEWVYVDDTNMQRACETCGRIQKSEKNVPIEDVDFPNTTIVNYTDAINGVSDGGKYLVFDFDILIDKSKANGTTEYLTTIRVMDSAATSGGNTVASFGITLYSSKVRVAGKDLPVVTTPMGETYITFRLVAELGVEQDASGNYNSIYYLFAKETGTDGPMTLVHTITKSSTYAGAASRYDNYKMVLTKENQDGYVLDVKNASLIRTDDTNYLYSACDHVMSAWSIVNEAIACTADGKATRFCTVDGCGYTETEYLPAHTLTTTPGVAPTCAAAGCTAYMTCSACQTVIGKADIPALGHVMSDWVGIDGQQKKTCQNGCGYYELRDVLTNAPITFDDGTITADGKITYIDAITVADDNKSATDSFGYAQWSVATHTDSAVLSLVLNASNGASGKGTQFGFATTDGSTEGNIYTLDFDLYIEPAADATNNSSRVAIPVYFGGASYSIGTYGATVRRYGTQLNFGTTNSWISFRFVFTVTENGKAETVVSVKEANGNYKVVETITLAGSGIKLDGVSLIGFDTYAGAGTFTNYIDNVSLTRHISGYEAE